MPLEKDILLYAVLPLAVITIMLYLIIHFIIQHTIKLKTKKTPTKRYKKITISKQELIKLLKKYKIKQIASILKCTTSTIYRDIKKYKIKNKSQPKFFKTIKI